MNKQTHNNRRVFFLDRDGVINADHGYVYKVEEFGFLPGVFEACRLIQSKGFDLVIVTNQAGIARGYYSESDFDNLTAWMLQCFAHEGVDVLDVFYCPHHPDKGIGSYKQDCNCRKPNPGMIEDAIKRYGVDVKNSVLVGDKMSDLEAGRRAGVGRLYGLQGRYPMLPADDIEVVDSLLEAAKIY